MTKMYFVSATIVNILLDLIIEYERVTRSIKDVAKLAYFMRCTTKTKIIVIFATLRQYNESLRANKEFKKQCRLEEVITSSIQLSAC